MVHADASDEARELHAVLRHLAHDFPDVPPEVLDAELALAMVPFDHATIRSYLPVLVEKQVRARLRAAQPRAQEAPSRRAALAQAG